LALARGAQRLLVLRYRELLDFNLVTRPPTDVELAGVILGPSGTLRAPSIRVGPVFVVGFSEELFQSVL
jgi:hypothetical protein